MHTNLADGTPVWMGLRLPGCLELLCYAVWLLGTTTPIRIGILGVVDGMYLERKLH